MVVLFFVLLFALSFLVWLLEVAVGERSMLGKNAGARVSGPLFSMDASGSVGKAITFGKWKGRPWVRVHFTPQNPKTEKQVNVRAAMALLVLGWQANDDAFHDYWDSVADQFNYSGFNHYIKKGMVDYVAVLTTSVTPTSLTDNNGIPSEIVYTWNA